MLGTSETRLGKLMLRSPVQEFQWLVLWRDLTASAHLCIGLGRRSPGQTLSRPQLPLPGLRQAS
jgi:hypothetical protein